MTKTIRNWSDEYDFLRNDFELYTPILLDGINKYETVEHAYQACKTKDPSEREIIRNAKNGREARRIGRSVTLDSQWEQNKYNIMKSLVHMKFYSNPDLAQRLVNTGSDIIELDTSDPFWGRANGDGRNLLGQILMQLREDLKPLYSLVKNDENDDDNDWYPKVMQIANDAGYEIEDVENLPYSFPLTFSGLFLVVNDIFESRADLECASDIIELDTSEEKIAILKVILNEIKDNLESNEDEGDIEVYD